MGEGMLFTKHQRAGGQGGADRHVCGGQMLGVGGLFYDSDSFCEGGGRGRRGAEFRAEQRM